MATTGVEMTADGVGLEMRLTHGPSEAVIVTVPPKDNGGTGESFSPTDLVGAALASCALTTMGLFARREGLPWTTTHAKVEKRMVGPPRRIGELVVQLRMPPGFPPEHRARYEEIGRTCPVAKSLHPDVRVPMEFLYPE